MNQAELNSILQEAKLETTPPQRLEALAKHNNSLVRKAVTENPNTPTRILFNLGEEFPHQLLANPLLDLLLLEDSNFFTKIPLNTLAAILPLEEVPEYLLNWATQQHDRERGFRLGSISNRGVDNKVILLAAIANPKISLATLKKLVRHQSKQLSQAASLHFKYSSKINSQQINKHIATAIRNFDRKIPNDFIPHLPWLEQLIPKNIKSQFSVYKKNYIKFHHPATLPHNGNNENQWTIQYQRNIYKQRLIHKYNHQDWEDYVNRFLTAKNPDTPVEILQQLVTDNNKSVRCYAAKNPNLPLSLRRQLAEDKHRSVRASVAKSPHTPASILEFLAEPKYGVRHEIAKNTNTPVEILIELAKNKHILASRRLAGNSSTPGLILQELSTIKDYNIKYQLAGNSSTPPETLLKLIQEQDSDSNIYHRIALNPNATALVLQELIKYCSLNTLLFVLSHPNCSLEIQKNILNFWAKDQSQIRWLWLSRLAVFFSPHAQPSVLASNARSIYWIERYAIAINPNTPQSIREILSQDSNIIVRNIANYQK
ncbi:MAG: hypothetical protein QNJ70_01165 [Xenococcaceae cyanobacterium MO_207.B15]|nr:hypothetical protein [Xenococcaceae cyanobacterium MO_207.B15]